MKRYAIWAAILFMTGGAHAQDVIKQDISVKTVTEAKVGDVLLRKGSVETIKIDASGKLNTKVFAAPQWDQTGKPLVEYDTTTGQVKAKSRYARFVPDEATGKLTVDRQVTNTGVKEFYTVPDEKTTKLTWTVDTDANEVEWDSAGKRLVFRGFDGLYMFESPPPVAWDADKKPVGVTAAYDKGVLTYTILEGEYRYPVTVDPSTTINGVINRIWALNNTYSTARNATSGDGVATNGGMVGQNYNAPQYQVYRSFLRFPGIPTMSTATACTLFFDGTGDYSDTDFNINIVGANASKSTYTAADYSLFDGWRPYQAFNGTILNNTWSSASYSADWNALIFNTAGLDTLIKVAGDTLWVAMISSRDWTSTNTPTGAEYITITSTSPAPYISFTYSASSPTPSRRTPFKNDPVPIFRNDPIPIWRR